MTYYFDHFLVTKIFVSFIFDSYLILIMILCLFVILKFDSIISSRMQLFFEKIITYFFEMIKKNFGNYTKLCLIFVIFVFTYLQHKFII